MYPLQLRHAAFILTFATSLLSIKTLKAQSKASMIASIRKEFQAINTDKSLSKKTLSEEEFLENTPDGGASLTGYYKKDSLVKIVEWVGLSYGNRTREFYLKKGSLIFVFVKFESFVPLKSGEGLDHSRVKTSFEGRYYFNKSKLIEQKVTGKQPMEDRPAAEITNELLETTKNYVQLLHK